MVLELREYLFGDAVVVSFAMPLRRDFAGARIDGPGVAPAEVNSKGDAIESFDHGVIGSDRTFEIVLGVLAA